MIAGALRRLREIYAPKGTFAANVITLVTGATLAQIIPLAISPLLTRLYSPEEFGMLALYVSLSGVMAIMATGRYELAVMLPDEDGEAANLVALSIVISIFVGLACLIGFFFWSEKMAMMLGNPGITNWLYSIPLVVVVAGVYQATSAWLNRKSRYRLIASSRISQSVVISSTNMGLGLAGCASAGLIVGEIVGQAAAAAITTKSALKDGRVFWACISMHGMRRQARKYCDFPKINLPHALGDMLQVSGVLLIIAYYFNPVILGYYAFSMKVLRSPIGIVGGAVSQVFYQKAVAVYSVKGDLRGLVAAMVKRLALISAPIFITLFMFAPSIFDFVFGAQWERAGVYVRILSPWIFLSFIASPISQIPIIVQLQRQVFFISILGNSVMLLSVFAAGYFVKDLEVGLYMMSGLMSFYMAAVIWWTLKIAGRRRGNV